MYHLLIDGSSTCVPRLSYSFCITYVMIMNALLFRDLVIFSLFICKPKAGEGRVMGLSISRVCIYSEVLLVICVMVGGPTAMNRFIISWGRNFSSFKINYFCLGSVFFGKLGRSKGEKNDI